MDAEDVLNKDEIALYDRQIRLWGMVAQARMRNVSVLIINFGALGGEIAKNLVLSGIGSLTVMDAHCVKESDLTGMFFVSKEDIGKPRVDAVKNRLQEMNPRVKLKCNRLKLDLKNEQYFAQFDLIIATELSKCELVELNRISRKYKCPLYAAGLNGLFSYIFIDLIEFDAIEERIKGQNFLSSKKKVLSSHREIIDVRSRFDETEKVEYEIVTTRNYYKSFSRLLEEASLEGKLSGRQVKGLNCTLPMVLAYLSYEICSDVCVEKFMEGIKAMCLQLGVGIDIINEEYVKMFLEQIGCEFGPVAAVVGGAVAQDVINVLGKRQLPLNNFVTLDGMRLDMQIFEL